MVFIIQNKFSCLCILLIQMEQAVRVAFRLKLWCWNYPNRRSEPVDHSGFSTYYNCKNHQNNYQKLLSSSGSAPSLLLLFTHPRPGSLPSVPASIIPLPISVILPAPVPSVSIRICLFKPFIIVINQVIIILIRFFHSSSISLCQVYTKPPCAYIFFVSYWNKVLPL